MFRFEVKDKTFSKSGDIKIKCTATIQTIYWRSNEESIQGPGSDKNNGFFSYDNRFWNSGGKAITLKKINQFIFLHFYITFQVFHFLIFVPFLSSSLSIFFFGLFFENLQRLTLNSLFDIATTQLNIATPHSPQKTFKVWSLSFKI